MNNTKKIAHKHEAHGDIRHDDYFWMRERDTAPVLEFLNQENARTAEALKDIKPLEEALYTEMRARIKEDDATVPVFEHGYHYYARFEVGKEYPIHCRKKGTLEAKEEVILDENVLAKGLNYFAVANVQTSPDQRLLAYAVDTVGRRIYDLHFKDLSTGRDLTDHVKAITPNFVWAADNRALFYTRQDPETLRSYQVYRYELGGKAPELVYEEKDTTYSVGVGGSKLNDRIYMAIEKRDSSEWHVLDAKNPTGPWHMLAPRESNMEYSVSDGGDRLFILTNWNAKNFRVMETSPTSTDKKQWKETVPTSDQIFIEGLDAYKDYLILSERENGLTQIRLRDRDSGGNRLLKFPDPAYEVAAMGLPEFDSPIIRFNYQSLVAPPTIYDENVKTEKRERRKVREVPGYNPELYESKRIWAEAKDGAKVPMSLLMKKGLKLDGKNPTLLYGYGSYGLTTDIYFRSSALSLVDRGFVFALAHIRGGSEMGRDWYEKGRLKHKMNTFTDFIACGEKLVKDKFTSPDHLHMMGGSAGGLLMGAVMNLRPDLFKGVVAVVPFVDVLTTMLDETIPLTTGEYKEWGDPRIKEQYMWMKEYSPVDNIAAKDYPNLLVTTGYHDSQVQYWEPAKWVAKLREMKTDKNHLLMFTEMNAGHSGASGRFEALKLLAKEYGFLLMLENIKC